MAERTETFVVEATGPRTRLDAFLRARFPGVSRMHLQRLIREGCVRVNGAVTKPTHQPRAGETIAVTWPEPRPATVEARALPLEIVFEDAWLVVLSKAPGMVVHPAAGHEDNTLVNALLHHCRGQLSGIGGVSRPGIVHRLDQFTSGLMVVAKNDPTHLALSRQFAERDVVKLYHAVLCGELPRSEGEINAAIARHPSHRKVMTVIEGGRAARTSYRVLERLEAATLIEARLHTGRTHQIRVHFKHLGFPLAGDLVYGKAANARLASRTGVQAPRQMLHASFLGFAHPEDGRRIEFRSPWPADFDAIVRALRIPAGVSLPTSPH
jgi:23S rRNA pseudouridine1911/1915/1917 synthase